MAISWLSQFSLNVFLLSSMILMIFLFLVRQKRASARKMLPPSPRKLPIIGNLHQLGPLQHRSLGALARKYGPVMLLHLGRVPTIIVSSMEMAQEIMKSQDLVFANRPQTTITKRLLYGKDIVFSQYGEHWRQVRRICILHMLSQKMVNSFRPIREEEVALMVEKIRSSCTTGPVNLSDMLYRLTNDIVCRAAFGKKYSSEPEGMRVNQLLREFGELLGKFYIGDLIPSLSWMDRVSGLHARVEKNFHELDTFIGKVIEDHLQVQGNRAREDTKDFVDILLSLDNNETSGTSLDPDTIRALVLDMFAGGTDSTFTAIEWTLAELLRHPKVMKRTQEEIRSVVGHKERVTEDDINKMIYLKAVIKESLRLHPPGPLLVPRESMGDTKLHAYHIPRGTRVIINAWAIGRDPATWERPEEFFPDRFLDNNIDFKGHDFQLIPFGGGRRGCPGIEFAVPTIELSITNILYHFDWAIADGTKGTDLDMSERSAVAVQRKNKLILCPNPHQFAK